jgi:hypothetical protein
MFDHERTLYAFVLWYARGLMADVDDADLAAQPAPGMNHPAWILGHLAIATDYALNLLGLPGHCPAAWHEQVGPGSTPGTDRAAYPGKAELLEALERGHSAVSEAAAVADPARLQAVHDLPFEFLQAHVPTVGDLIAHLMTTHPAVHLGQLSAWRRLRGLPGVLGV